MRYKRKKNYWQQDIRRRDYLLAVLTGSFVILMFSYLFYGTCLCAILLAPYLVYFLKSWEKQWIEKRKNVFQLQFKEAVQSLATALNVGYSVENAMREALKDLQIIYKKDELIVREFRYMVRQLDVNVTMEKVLQEFSQRTGDVCDSICNGKKKRRRYDCDYSQYGTADVGEGRYKKRDWNDYCL